MNPPVSPLAKGGGDGAAFADGGGAVAAEGGSSAQLHKVGGDFSIARDEARGSGSVPTVDQNTVALLGGISPPPKLRFRGLATISIGGDLALFGAVGFVNTSAVALTVEGDFINESVRSECFDCATGAITMDGAAAQRFEVAGSDVGGAPALDADFVIGTVTVAADANVTFTDDFDNDGQFQGSCTEAQYVDTFIVEAGAAVTLDNCRVYYLNASIDPTATVNVTGCGEHRYAVAPSAPLGEPAALPKTRFLSFVLPVSEAGVETALRVRLSSLHHPATPASAPDLSAQEGLVRYVNTLRDGSNMPVTLCPDSGAFGPYRCATLGCEPEYRDWAGELNGEPLHVAGSAIAPSSRYELSILAQSCQGNEFNCTAVSPELTMLTGLWGDVTPDQLNILDVSTQVDKLKNVGTARYEPAHLVHAQQIDPLTESVNVLDIAFTVDALKGLPYAFTIDSCP